MLRTLGLSISALLAPLSAATAQTIGNGQWSIRLDPIGVMVGPPPEGVAARYGPPHQFARGAVEWFGLSFDLAGGHVSAVGAGPVADYALRTPVVPIGSRFHADRATMIGRVGALEIEHTFEFCPFTQCLTVAVVLRNRGPLPIENIVYSREWRGGGIPAGTFPPEWDPALPPNPGDVWRMTWMPNHLLPGREQGAAFAVQPPTIPTSGINGDDVPLEFWKSPKFPDGLVFGLTYGINFGDYDHDGWVDVALAEDEAIWRNLGGTDWIEQVDLSPWMPPDVQRYGLVLFDYDGDQLLDIADEPRGPSNPPEADLYFLHALDGDQFEEIAGNPAIVDSRPFDIAGETNVVADVDGDGWLDLFIPSYPPWYTSTGNWYLHNDGPGDDGVFTFRELSGPAGLDNPPQPVSRPEGCEFHDVDFDGDVDLYSCNTIYRNLSTPGNPLFEAMTETGSGVIHSDVLEEGGGFLDYDMDGDLDLCLVFCDGTLGIRMYDNLGDGTFAIQPKSLFDAFNSGLCLGLSFADWDNDGDIDVNDEQVFRRNQFIETGARHYTVATHSIDGNHISAATPAWGDWDQDGDVDSAIGNYSERGRLYDNYLYGPETSAAEKRHVRIRVVRDSDRFDDGTETEFGAHITLTPLDHPTDGSRRSAIVSAGGGYLNQNEYVRHFALPVDPDPDPAEDVHFRVSVDFKGAAEQGTVRVDRHVNPVLAEINLAFLVDREITIFRSGRVVMDGCDYRPAAPSEALTTVNGGLALAGVDQALAAPIPAPGADWFVGLEIDTTLATTPQRIEELVIDGRLAANFDCAGVLANLFAWDVTDPSAPTLVPGGMRSYPNRPRNQRNYYGTDLTLEPGRVYRIAARVNTLRATAVSAPLVDDVFTTTGGLSFSDATPCTGAAIAAATVDSTRLWMTVRFRDEPAGAWVDLGHALAGTNGEPQLAVGGDLRPGSLVTADVTNGQAGTAVLLVVGMTPACLPIAEGLLVPALDVILSGLTTDASGHASLSDCVGDDVAPGTVFYVQAALLDPGAPHGLAFTNCIAGTTPR